MTATRDTDPTRQVSFPTADICHQKLNIEPLRKLGRLQKQVDRMKRMHRLLDEALRDQSKSRYGSNPLHLGS